MRSSTQKCALALVISLALLFSSFISAHQGAAQTQTRPRRVTPVSDETRTDARHPAPLLETDKARAEEDLKERVEHEPTLRIGLTTTARSVTISTTGQLLDTTNAVAPPAPFETARVRIEPRLQPPLTLPAPETDSFADVAAAEVARASGNARRSDPTPERRAPATSPAVNNAKSAVRLVSRVNEALRGAVLYAPGATTPLRETRAPVIFASDDEALHPVRFNEKPYRGQLEVFANLRGSLTVINVIKLEDYVRGVVPNELSPGGFPALEALKAQAVAARTYAISNLKRFEAEGFDLLPTTRSQVYGGLSTEHPLTDRAVAETRGRVATYKGQPINALYTSTCGGRTEHAENIFGGEATPYLRARECAYEAKDAFSTLSLRTSRDLPEIKLPEHASSARDAALLAVHGFSLPPRLTDIWLAAPVPLEDVRALLGKVAALTRQTFYTIPNDAVRPAGFATALAHALDGESRGDVLLNEVDINYLLSFRDADEVPEPNRADVAIMLRDGHLSLFPDATLRPRQPMSRARALHALAHALEGRGLFQLQKATARPSTNGALVVRAAGKSPDKSFSVSPRAFILRALGDSLFPVRELSVVGGEPLVFHTDQRGEVDYLEARPAPSGAAPDHFSAYANWTVTLTPAAAQVLLGRAAANTGTLLDLRVRARGQSRRALDLEVVGTNGTAHIRNGRIRSALGLREQLFVIDRLFEETGRVKTFIITGRGWGHGVGMCQVGAYGMARFGMSYEKILKAYYTDIKLTRLY